MQAVLEALLDAAELETGRSVRRMTTAQRRDPSRQKAKTAAQICEVMRYAPFYCGTYEGGEHYPWCCSQHAMGLPKHRITGVPCAPTDFQLELANDIINNRLAAQTGHLDPFQKYHINKGRQMGFTEIVLRVMAHLAFSAYKGRNIGIMAATNGRLARKNLARFRRLFSGPLSPVLGDAPKNSTVLEILPIGTTIEAFPAAEEAATGDTQYGAFLIDEMAKWKLLDDKPVFNSVLPFCRSSGADLMAVSTPKGPQKTFYHIHCEPGDYRMYQFPITRAITSGMYTRKEVDKMIEESKKKNPEIDIAQEYFCQFISSSDSIFGALADDAVELEWPGWAPEEPVVTPPAVSQEIW